MSKMKEQQKAEQAVRRSSSLKRELDAINANEDRLRRRKERYWVRYARHPEQRAGLKA